MIGYFAPYGSSFVFAWLASHRGRLRSFVFGGHRLSFVVFWDTEGNARMDHTERDVDAMAQLVHGDPPKESEHADRP